jgi:glycosyltransferase involved in cell wall biosynthesis
VAKSEVGWRHKCYPNGTPRPATQTIPGLPLRILQVIHQFPPYSSQGSEVYCYTLSKRLSETDDVRVFHVSNTARRRPRRLDRSTYDGLPTYHCIDGGEYSRVADWQNGFLRRQFQAVLGEWAPEIVHFHNFVSLGDDLVTMARRGGAAVVYTLHDFGLICPNTLLLRSDGQLCGKADPDFFQDCCPDLIRTAGGRAPILAAGLPSLARWRLYANQHPRRAMRTALKAAVGVAERWWGGRGPTDVARKRDFFLTQTRRIFRDVHLFLAPSEFLRQRYISCGVPPEKITYARYGMRPFPREARERPTDRVSFGYIGALHAHKGIELLLEAFQGLGDRADLHIYGSAFGSPISESYWQRIRARHGTQVVFHGAYDNRRIGAILASLDAVVVPSLWYENSPLTIQEAFIGGVPVVTADRGGMAELVRDGVDGLHFRLGDVADLRAKLLYLVDHPDVLGRLRRNVPRVPEIDRQAADVRARYEALLS